MTHLFPTRRSSDLSKQASLLLHLTGESAWEQDLPRMAQGLLNMQRNGAWRTTTANLLGSLAIEKFSQHYESTPLSGQLRIALAKEGEIQTFDWDAVEASNGVKEHEDRKSTRLNSSH